MTTENIRVYEAAKELGLTNKEMIEQLESKIGVKVKSHSSTLSASQYNRFKEATKSPNADPVKKPKAFIVKKAKPKQEEPVEEVKKDEPVEEEKEVPEQEVVPEIVIESKEEEKPAEPVVPSTPSIRSLLEYNNRNSQRRRAEIQAQNLREKREQERVAAEKRNAELAKKRREERPTGSSDSPYSQRSGRTFDRNQRPSDRPARPTDRPARPYDRPARPSDRPARPTDRTGRPTDRPARPTDRPGRPTDRTGRPTDRPSKPGETPVKRHFISQDIYDNKPGAGKRKDVKAKEKQYKSKEEQQELISLEKAMAQKHRKKEKSEDVQKEVTSVVINSVLTVGELADKLNRSAADIVKFLMMQGILATVNQVIDIETQKKVCADFEISVQEEDVDAFIEQELEKEEHLKAITDVDDKLLKPRAPVVSILGHVDHGKTTLLDAIRQSKQKITSTEVGGITQSIGAYTVWLNDKKIVFIDTPGHEAFTEMRARGAKATDIAILVVAADDGIMPQTIEAINHAKAAEVPIIVAVNKVDKPDADPDKILQQLTEYGLVPEAWGGDTVCVKVSGLQKTGIDELLEYILIMSEVQNHKANPEAPATGVIIESNLDKGKGPVATLLVQNGTLHTGDCFVVGTVCGKVRALLSDSGERIKKAGPSTPVEILGLTEVPQSGDFFEAVENEKVMRQIAAERRDKERNSRLEAMMPAHVRNDAVGTGEDEIQRLNLIIKANTHGAAEAVSQAVNQLESKEIITKIIHVGVGDISEADVMLASAGNAIILGFTVKEDANVLAAAEKYNVTVKKFDIIYQILEDLEQTMLNLLQPEIKEVELGTAEVRQIFTVGKTSKIAGCYVLDGKIVRNKIAIVTRNGNEIFKGPVDQLKRFKDDVKEVAQGFECGISFSKFNDLQEGDIIKVTTTETVERQVLV